MTHTTMLTYMSSKYRFGKNQNESDDNESDDATVLAKTETESSNYSGPSTISTIPASVTSATTHTSESTIIYSEDDDRLYDKEQMEQQSNDSAESVIINPNYASTATDDTDKPFSIRKLPRPKAGWDTSPYASFGTIVPTLENSMIFPRPPNHGRLFWFVATGNTKHGYNSGVLNEEYLARIEKVYATKIQSRNTTNKIRNFLARNPNLLDPNRTWAQCIREAWKLKFPGSSICPDPSYQKVRDPQMNKAYLPIDQFTEDDFTYLRAREMSNTVIYNRSAHAVLPQAPILSPQWDAQQQQRLTAQAYAEQARQQVRVEDPVVLDTLMEYDSYVQHFKENGQAWPKPEGLANAISRMKNIADEKDFEKKFFLTKQMSWTNPSPVSSKCQI